MIHIYKVISSILLLTFVSVNLFADEDVNSYCFEKNISMSQVENVISFLVVGGDRLNKRENDHCIDIVTTPARLKLYEKLIWKNFRPIKDTNLEIGGDTEGSLNEEHCRIEITESKKQKSESTEVRMGLKTNLGKNETQKDEKTTQELMIVRGKTATMRMGDQYLQIQCIKTVMGTYQLSIFLDEKNKSSISTSVNLKAGEVINLGNIKKELNEKSKRLGIPNFETKEQIGNDEINYELKMK